MRGVLVTGGLALAGLALAALPLPLAAGLVLGTMTLVIVLAQPVGGLILLLVAVPFGSPFNIQIGGDSAGQGFNFGPTEILFALTMAGWLGRMVIARSTTRGEERRWPPITVGGWPALVWPLAAFLFVLALTLTVTRSLPSSLKELLKWSEVLLVMLFTAKALPRKHVPLLFIVLFAVAAAESAVGLYQTITRNGPPPFFVPLGGQLIMRAYGTFEQPNPFAAYLNLTLPVSLSLLFFALSERL
ncbi:MAG: hypothetical protein HY259_11325, partial [Chloroflexi bacterium]|nr:hypothetical protein [Chloroflexota bacterium]